MNLPPSMGLSGEGPKRLFGGKPFGDLTTVARIDRIVAGMLS